MSPDSSDPRTLVADVLTAGTADQERLPALLGLLDVGDRQVRLGAAVALCVVADDNPDVVPSVVRRLLDRTDDGGAEAAIAVEYLAACYPDAVEAELDALDGDDRRHGGEPQSGPARRSSLTGRDIGRTRLAGSGIAAGPRRVYTRDEEDEVGREDTETDDGDDAAADEQTMGDRPNGGPLATDADWLSFVEYESRFDSLSVLAPRDRRRFGDVYRTMGVTADGELPVAVKLFRGPTGADGAQEFDSAFVSAVGERLDDWASVAATANVVTLYDWASEPRLWAATEYTDETLADRGRLQPDEAAWHAERLAEAVATLHERGVVHAGIDPQSVAYYGNVLEEGDRQPPLLDNVGLLHAYRARFDPSAFLDPRYAAPEYYERRFGRIDHATDIYQLGAVCYRLFTGRPPYAGEFDTVRERVLNAPPPKPSDVSSVPDAVDDVVGKAMATQKLRRYETAAHLAQELRALGNPRPDNGG